jgi:hypothetical protein
VLSPASLFFTRIVIVGDVGFLALSDV